MPFAYTTSGRYASGRRVWCGLRVGRWYVFVEVARWAVVFGDAYAAPRGYRWQRRPET